MASSNAFVIAARRTALGRVGGLHRQRRVDDLTAPVVHEALKEARLSPARVDQLILGNTSAGSNPARLVALASGLPEGTPAYTLDQQCASGLQAILSAIRLASTGEADVVVAGGAEAISMAPWRIAKPRSIHQLPRFIGIGADDPAAGMDQGLIEAGDRFAASQKISRERQDEYAFRTHLSSSLARDNRRFVKEIVPLKATVEEGRDQSAVEPGLDELNDLPPLRAEGTLTSGNISQLHDGAAMTVIVSQRIWDELGRPPALQLTASATVGVAPQEGVDAPIVALRRLVGQGRATASAIDVVELNESSAAQAIAFRDAFSLSDGALNPDGGAIARGNPLGVAGAVLVVRLFSRMARAKAGDKARTGAAVLGAIGGQGVAALFQGT